MPGLNVGDEGVAVIASVGNDLLGVAASDQRGTLGDIMFLSRRQIDLHRFSQAVAGHMNFRSESATRSSQRLCLWTTAFGAGRMLMRPNNRGIQQQNTEVRILQLLHDRLEQACFAPAIER